MEGPTTLRFLPLPTHRLPVLPKGLLHRRSDPLRDYPLPLLPIILSSSSLPSSPLQTHRGTVVVVYVPEQRKGSTLEDTHSWSPHSPWGVHVWMIDPGHSTRGDHHCLRSEEGRLHPRNNGSFPSVSLRLERRTPGRPFPPLQPTRRRLIRALVLTNSPGDRHTGRPTRVGCPTTSRTVPVTPSDQRPFVV